MIQVKQVVNTKSLLGGGLGETRFEVWGPLWWSQITTKVVVMGESAGAGEAFLPAVVFGGE